MVSDCLSFSLTEKVGNFSTSNPYDNNMNLQESYTCSSGFAAIKITRFETEENYDIVTAFGYPFKEGVPDLQYGSMSAHWESETSPKLR